MTNEGNPDPDFILRGSSAPITSLLYLNHDESTHLLSGNQNGQLDMWDFKTRRVCQSHAAHPGSVLLHLEQLDKVQFLSQGRDGFVHVWKSNGSEWHQNSKCFLGGIESYHLAYFFSYKLVWFTGEKAVYAACLKH